MASDTDVTLQTRLDEIQNQIVQLKEDLLAKLSQYEDQKKSGAIFDHENALNNVVDDPIKLNIGGKIFMTSKSTLLKEESMFSAMFSGRHELKKGSDGAYFIDRDPKHFRKILNFLRDGECIISHKGDKKEILREAEFYSLASLVDYLNPPVIEQPEEPSEYDSTRKGPNVIIEGSTARCKTSNYFQSAFTKKIFSAGIHKCTFNAGNDWLVGISGANIDATHKRGAFGQRYSMMLSISGAFHVAGVLIRRLEKIITNSITVTLNCDTRTVEWRCGSLSLSERIHDNLQPPFSFCVDLWDSFVTITDIN